MITVPPADVTLALLQLGSATAETTLVRQVASEPTLLEQVMSIASGLMTIALLVLTVALVPAAWNFRKSYKRVSDLLDRVYADINPIMRHASSIADDVNYITTSIRVDVQQVNRTIAGVNQRLQDAIALTERQLHDFNALLEVVQQEAEDAFVSTASTLRGVRGGAMAYRRGAEDADDEVDAVERDDLDAVEYETDLDDADAAAADEWGLFDAAGEAEEMIDGDDSTNGDEGDRPRPRVKRRGRG